MKKSRKRTFLSIILCAAMLLPLFGNMIVSNAAGDTYCDWDTIAECRENQEAPVISGTEGKVFAGWYKDADYKNELKANETVEGAYAKFVDKNALTIRYQETAGTTTVSKQTDLRLLTTVDSLNYQKIEFDIEVNGITKTVESNKAYETIYGFTSDGVNAYTPDAAFECADSEYFMAFNLKEVPNSVFSTPITVTPKWTTLDGITVTGTPSTFIIKDNLGDIVVQNPEGAKALIYQYDATVTAGQTVSFGLKITNPTEAIGLYVFTSEESTASPSYYELIPAWTGVKEFSIPLTHGGTFVKIAAFCRNAAGNNYDAGLDILKNVVMAISELKIEDPVEETDDIVVTNPEGAKALIYQHNGAVTAGQTVSFGLKIENPTEAIGLYVFTSNESVDSPSYYELVPAWTGVKEFSIPLKHSGEWVKIAAFCRYANGSNYTAGADVLKNVVMTISELKIEDPSEEVDNIVVTNTIGNKAIVYQHDGAVTAGQTVSFGLEVANPTAKLGVFVFTDAEGAGANSSYYQQLDPWNGVKDFNVTFKTSGTLFKIAVFLRKADGSNYGGGEDILKTTGMTISELKIEDPAEEVEDIVVTNTIGNKAIVYQHDGAVTAGQTVSFGLEVANPTAKLGVFVFTDTEGAGANSSYYQQLDPWNGVKDFNVTFKTSGTLFKIAVFLRDASGSNYNGGEDILKTTGMTIKNLTF